MGRAADDAAERMGRQYADQASERAGRHYADSDYPVGPEGSGWIMFAGVLLGLAGIWNTLNGILAIGKSKVFVNEASYVFSDLRTWGWIILLLGILQLAAAFMLATGSEFARWTGIGVAGLNAIGQLFYLPAQPLWAMAMFAVDILIIYGLAVYAGKRLTE
jgi:hypothetical protein